MTAPGEPAPAVPDAVRRRVLVAGFVLLQPAVAAFGYAVAVAAQAVLHLEPRTARLAGVAGAAAFDLALVLRAVLESRRRRAASR